MIIALDYDGTYTIAPDFWLDFIMTARQAGHRVICVTMRSMAEAELMDPRLQDIETICTNRRAKAKVAAEFGIFPHVWIDDNPAWIYCDAGDRETVSTAI